MNTDGSQAKKKGKGQCRTRMNLDENIICTNQYLIYYEYNMYIIIHLTHEASVHFLNMDATATAIN